MSEYHINPLKVRDCSRVVSPSFRDARGSFYSPLRSTSPANISKNYSNVYVSKNTHTHTLRGFHYQDFPHGENKIVTAITGSALHVVVRLCSDHTVQIDSNLLDSPSVSTFVASDCASAFLTLEPNTTILYLSDHEYVPSASRGYLWNDSLINFNWGVDPSSITISDRDLSHPPISFT